MKADGLCAGKGVVIAHTQGETLAAAEAMLSGEAFGAAGRRIVYAGLMIAPDGSPRVLEFNCLGDPRVT